LIHGFKGFSSYSLSHIALGLWQHSTSWQKHMVEEAAYYMLTSEERREGKRERGKARV
jgi:hypothetical protein